MSAGGVSAYRLGLMSCHTCGKLARPAPGAHAGWCPRCGAALTLDRAIEVGHIFELGRRYSEPFDATVLGADGTPVHLWMGSYGIGVERTLAAIVEAHHDERGIVWPAAVAPFAVVVTTAQPDDAEVAAAGETMPPKSTYFFPKVMTGIAFNPLS